MPFGTGRSTQRPLRPADGNGVNAATTCAPSPLGPPGTTALDLAPAIDPSIPGRHVVWIVSPAGYVHSHAFDEVADAFAEGLGALGHPVPVVRDPAAVRDTVPIVLGSHLLDPRSQSLLPEGSVLVNLEQVDTASKVFTEDHFALLSRHAVLDYSSRNLAALRRAGIGHARLLRVGWSPGLARIAPEGAGEVDVCFYGSVNARRAALLDELERRGLVVERLFGVYGAARDQAVARAKVVLNCHYFESSIFEAVRVSYLAGNGVCVVTEGSPDDEDLAPWIDGLEVASYDHLADACEALVHDPDRRRDLAAAAVTAAETNRQDRLWRRLLGGCGAPDAPEPAVTIRPARPPVQKVSLIVPAHVPDACLRAEDLVAALEDLGVAAEALPVAAASDVERVGLRCSVRRTDGPDVADADPVVFDHRGDHLVIVDAALATVVGDLAPFRLAVWWCGVDDLVTGDGPLADADTLARVLTTPGVEHLHQSAYAREFLRSRAVASWPLPDVVDALSETASPPERRTAHLLVGPPGHPSVAPLIDACAGLDIRPLADDPARWNELGEALGYVHVAPQSGRDRLPRLAAAHGSVVVVLAAGAARFVEDVAVPDAQRFDDHALHSGALCSRLRSLLASPTEAWEDQSWYRDTVAAEPDERRRAIRRLLARR
jgi:hypothetical protein